jgi:FkbM family methyltransferase
MLTKLLFLPRAAARFRNFHRYLFDSLGWLRRDYVLGLRDGLNIHVRAKRRTDVADVDIIREVILEDEYDVGSIRPGDVVVDIGAQIGSFTLLAARRARRVYSYEPAPGNYSQLRRNVALNRLENVESFNEAVTATDGAVRLFESGTNQGAHSIIQEGEGVEVASVSLKSVVERAGAINLLKMDCEGAEYPIILDSPPDCFERIDRILMELHQTPAIEGLYESRSVLDRLAGCGFGVAVLKEVYYPGEGRFWLVHAAKPGAARAAAHAHKSLDTRRANHV